MCDTFPEAMVSGYEALVPGMTNEDKDRHVLAAAVRADAAVIVTFNLKDFPKSALDTYDINAVHPDDFLLDQLDLYPAPTVQCVRAQVLAYRKPAMSIDEFLTTFEKTVPKFTHHVRQQLM